MEDDTILVISFLVFFCLMTLIILCFFVEVPEKNVQVLLKLFEVIETGLKSITK